MRRSFRHWTPRYVVNRVALALYERGAPEAPWITRDACRRLEQWLRPHHVGLEWGSGRSTLWFGARVGRLTSVEHDREWHARVTAKIAERGVANVDYRLALLEEVSAQGVPTYVNHGAALGSASVDFALVDGMYRDRCVETAMDVLRPGGLLIIDNAERYLPHASHAPSSLARTKAERSPLWRRLERDLADWRCEWTSNGAFDTALFTKPTPPRAALR